MDKLVAFFKNVWFRRALSLICCAYSAFMVWVAWLCFGFYFRFDNPTPAFVLYLFINIAALGFFILSRKQVLTQINSYLLPLIVFAITFFAFGNWYIIIPPAVVMLVLFFVNTSNETLKTVLGTMALLMFVIGIVGRIGVVKFMGNINHLGPDLSQRDLSYSSLSPDGEYRLVRYFEKSAERSTVTYYVEKTDGDKTLPQGVAQKVFGCKKVRTAPLTDKNMEIVKWKTVTVNGKKTEMLEIEGNRTIENPYLEKEEKASVTKSSTSSVTSGTVESSQTEESSVRQRT